jgi:hypothetical protein
LLPVQKEPLGRDFDLIETTYSLKPFVRECYANPLVSEIALHEDPVLLIVEFRRWVVVQVVVGVEPTITGTSGSRLPEFGS